VSAPDGSISKEPNTLEVFLDATAILLPVLYLVTTGVYGAVFFQRHPTAERLAPKLLWGTVALHAFHLFLMGLQWGQFPATTVAQALGMVAFAVAVVYAVVEWLGEERSTGFWLLAMVFLLQLSSALLQRPEPPQREIFESPLFATHVSLAILGYAAFVIAAAYGFLFLELYRELKKGRFSTFFGKLPPLEVLERMMVGSLTVGVITLLGAVAAGVVWAELLLTGGWIRDPKILATLAILLFYMVALALRRVRRWQGRQTAVAALTGLAAILVSLFAVNFLFSDFHGFL
jgi:HemX protein